MQDASLSIVLDSNDNIVLVRRNDVPVWVLPGGGISPGESPEEAAIRETFEESGLNVSIKEQVAIYSPINSLASTTYLFSCHIETKDESHKSDEVSAIGSFALDQLPKNLFPLHRTFIQEWLTAPVLPIVRPLTEVTYLRIAFEFLKHPLWLLRYFWTRFTKK